MVAIWQCAVGNASLERVVVVVDCHHVVGVVAGGVAGQVYGQVVEVGVGVLVVHWYLGQYVVYELGVAERVFGYFGFDPVWQHCVGLDVVVGVFYRDVFYYGDHVCF